MRRRGISWKWLLKTGYLGKRNLIRFYTNIKFILILLAISLFTASFLSPETSFISTLIAFLLFMPIKNMYFKAKEARRAKKEECELKYFLMHLNNCLNSKFSLYESLKLYSGKELGKRVKEIEKLIEKGVPAYRAFAISAKNAPTRVQEILALISDSLEKGTDLKLILPELIENERRIADVEQVDFLEACKGYSIVFLYLTVLLPSVLLISYPILSFLGLELNPELFLLAIYPILPALLLIILLHLYLKAPVVSL